MHEKFLKAPVKLIHYDKLMVSAQIRKIFDTIFEDDDEVIR